METGSRKVGAGEGTRVETVAAATSICSSAVETRELGWDTHHSGVAGEEQKEAPFPLLVNLRSQEVPVISRKAVPKGQMCAKYSLSG